MSGGPAFGRFVLVVFPVEIRAGLEQRATTSSWPLRAANISGVLRWGPVHWDWHPWQATVRQSPAAFESGIQQGFQPSWSAAPAFSSCSTIPV
jgi:hypothetical protein